MRTVLEVWLSLACLMETLDLLPTQTMASSSHHYRAASCTSLSSLTLLCPTLLRIPPLLLMSSVLVLPLFYLQFTSLSYFPDGVIHPDVLNCHWYGGDSQIYICSPNFPPIFRSVFLSSSRHLHGCVYMDSTHFPITSWIQILVTFITIYIGSPARNIYGLKFLPISY